MNNLKPSGRSGYIRIEPMRRKKCSRCQIERPLNQFGNCKEAKDGKNWICKDCHENHTNPHGKWIYRYCLKCQNRFRSFNGHRLCTPCNNSNKYLEEPYSNGGITYKRTGARG